MLGMRILGGAWAAWRGDVHEAGGSTQGQEAGQPRWIPSIFSSQNNLVYGERGRSEESLIYSQLRLAFAAR